MCEVPQLSWYLASCILVIYLQPGDVAHCVVLVGAVALDGRVDAGVVDVGAVRRRAAARIAGGVPFRLLVELLEHSLQRLRLNPISRRRRCFLSLSNRCKKQQEHRESHGSRITVLSSINLTLPLCL